MHLERYDYTYNDDFTEFYFTSVGPKGAIGKIVKYDLVHQILGIRIVNLCFGDWDETSRFIDYSITSNNNDRDKILATIAFTTLRYVENYGNCRILIAGQSAAKTRLYQMALNAHRNQIEVFFSVLGQYMGSWFEVEHGHNYDAFLIVPKDLVNLF